LVFFLAPARTLTYADITRIFAEFPRPSALNLYMSAILLSKILSSFFPFFHNIKSTHRNLQKICKLQFTDLQIMNSKSFLLWPD